MLSRMELLLDINVLVVPQVFLVLLSVRTCSSTDVLVPSNCLLIIFLTSFKYSRSCCSVLLNIAQDSNPRFCAISLFEKSHNAVNVMIAFLEQTKWRRISEITRQKNVPDRDAAASG